MTQFFVHRRDAHRTTPETEHQLQAEDEARAFGYQLIYTVFENRAYDVFVELSTDLEFIEFKLRCM